MRGQYKRFTSETEIEILLDTEKDEYDGLKSDTGIGFLNHMLITFGRYASLNGYIKVKGDLFVDTHHTIEDTAIALGKTLKDMIDDVSIKRYANAIIPMDEALVRTVIDMGGRAYLDFDYEFKREKIGDYDTDMTLEFLRAIANNSESTIHIDVLKGKNDHHITEAIFKSLGMAIKDAIAVIEGDVFSTKGKIKVLK